METQEQHFSFKSVVCGYHVHMHTSACTLLLEGLSCLPFSLLANVGLLAIDLCTVYSDMVWVVSLEYMNVEYINYVWCIQLRFYRMHLIEGVSSTQHISIPAKTVMTVRECGCTLCETIWVSHTKCACGGSAFPP